MDFLDVVIFTLFRGCELAGAAIFAFRLRTSRSGILGTAGFLGLVLSSIGQRVGFSMLGFSQTIWIVATAGEILSIVLILLAIWLMDENGARRPVKNS